MDSYRKSWEQIVRPPRVRYSEEDFSLPESVGGVGVVRENYHILSANGKSTLSVAVLRAERRPCDSLCVYLHTFSGSRLEGRFLVELLLPGVAVALFDALGCGNAEGEYVTLGLREKDDLERVVLSLHRRLGFSRLMLYGRSMGAATILHFLSTAEPRLRRMNGFVLCAVVIDSSFTDAYAMVRDLLIRKGTAPLLATMMLFPAKMSIRAALGRDVLGANRPGELAAKMRTPACFLIGGKDTLIGQTAFVRMFEQYGAQLKKLVVMEGVEHADERPHEALIAAAEFLKARAEECKAPTQPTKHLSATVLPSCRRLDDVVPGAQTQSMPEITEGESGRAEENARPPSPPLSPPPCL